MSQPHQFGEMTSVDGRNSYIDVLRGISIFGVVCIHFGGSFAASTNAWTHSFYLGLSLNQIFSFAVPLFIFLAGILSGHSSDIPPNSIWSYYRKRLWRIGLPYLAASAVSFVILGHAREWAALPDNFSRFSWLIQRIFVSGIEPTLYFIPLIIKLYLLQPALRRLPSWIQSLFSRTGKRQLNIAPITLALALLFLAVHLALAVLCYRNILNYYTWARPGVSFWLFYFFAGLHFHTIKGVFSRRWLIVTGVTFFLVACGAMISDGLTLTNRQIVGPNFEFSKVDYAYVRPEILCYNLAVVGGLAVGLGLGWKWRSKTLAIFGQSSLSIYLWHILLLYEIAWQYGTVMESCRQMPELMIIIAAVCCWSIAQATDWFTAGIAFIRKNRNVSQLTP